MELGSQKNEATLVIRLRPSRLKAKAVAAAEILAVLRDLGAVCSLAGPLAEIRGITWVSIPEDSVDIARSRLRRLGYTRAVDLVGPPTGSKGRHSEVVRWKGHNVALERIYDEPDAQLRDSAPDRRTFLLECGDGVVRRIPGYRGGRGPLEHRALPVVDARLLVNLVFRTTNGTLLDPFAGAGGIVTEAGLAGWTVVSLDSDPALRFGLSQLADCHIVGNAKMLPLADESVDAIASEPPYHPTYLEVVAKSIREMARVLRPGGCAALLVESNQVDRLSKVAQQAGLRTELDEPINRKGTSVSCLCWAR